MVKTLSVLIRIRVYFLMIKGIYPIKGFDDDDDEKVYVYDVYVRLFPTL